MSRILHHFKAFLVLWWNIKDPSLFSFSFQLWFLCFPRIGCFSLRFFWQVWPMFWPNTVRSRELPVHLCIDVRPEYILSKTHAWYCVNLSPTKGFVNNLSPSILQSSSMLFFCNMSRLVLVRLWMSMYLNGVGKFVLGTLSFRIGIAWFLNISCPVLL